MDEVMDTYEWYAIFLLEKTFEYLEIDHVRRVAAGC